MREARCGRSPCRGAPDERAAGVSPDRGGSVNDPLPLSASGRRLPPRPAARARGRTPAVHAARFLCPQGIRPRFDWAPRRTVGTRSGDALRIRESGEGALTLLLPLDDLLAVVHESLNPNVSRSGIDRRLRQYGGCSSRALKPKAPESAQALQDPASAAPCISTWNTCPGSPARCAAFGRFTLPFRHPWTRRPCAPGDPARAVDFVVCRRILICHRRVPHPRIRTAR